MMSGFRVKLATTIVVVFLMVDTSALLNDGGVGLKSLPHVFGSSRKAFPGKEGSFGCKSLVISGKKNFPLRDLRSIPWSPPAPLKSRQRSFGSRAPPPQII